MKKNKTNKKIKNIIIFILILCIIISATYAIYYLYDIYITNKEYEELLNNVNINSSEMAEEKTDRILKLEKIQEKNKEIVGWLEISGTNINYPILQSSDNDFYLTHDYKKEKSSTGSLFLDKECNLESGTSNYLIYGHRSLKGFMFEDLMKYAKKDFYEEHKTIRFTTNEEDSLYEIIAVFYSRVYYKNEKDVFRYYYFINAENEEEYNNFVNNAKKSSIYDTGITAEYGEQLLTLSTCEYSQEDGRFAVVCKKMKK